MGGGEKERERVRRRSGKKTVFLSRQPCLKKKDHSLVLLITPFCALVAYLVFFISGAPPLLLFFKNFGVVDYPKIAENSAK